MSTTSSLYQLEFEKSLTELERQIEQIETDQHLDEQTMKQELKNLRKSHSSMLRKTYQKLSPWQTVQVARHPDRPQTRDYINMFVKDFCELHGDRRYSDDKAIITGFGRIGPHKCMLVGHQKGRGTKDKLACNFGMPHPEGYRKALSKMKLAEKFNLPVVTLIDTAGAYPGIGAEERGQAEAIALNLLEMSRLRVPIVCCVIGEGGSGGALGIGVGDRIAMMQYAWYSVISPEGCAAILWKSAEQSEEAATQLSLTAKDNLSNGIVDEVIDEPMGGAHRDHVQTAANLENWIIQNLKELKRYKIDNLLARRYDKFRKMGAFIDV